MSERLPSDAPSRAPAPEAAPRTVLEKPLEVRPGQKVTPEQRTALDALGVAPGKRVPSVGVVEVWGAWARVTPDGQVHGSLRLRRCEPEEAARFDDLARHIDLGEGRGEPSADDRSRLEAIALRMNTDLLRTADELAALSKRGRSALVRRCLSAMDAAPGACSEEGLASLVGRVKNDDLKVGERTRHAVLWLLLRDRAGGVAASDADGDVVDWALRHEEAREGLTGVISACDDLFREVSGHRPSSTLSSRLDRASAMRYVVDSTRAPSVSRGEAGRAASATMVASVAGPVPDASSVADIARLREQVTALEARLESADRAQKDAQDTTRQLSDEVARLTLALEEARRHNERLRQGASPASQRGARDPEKARVEQREPPNAALTPEPTAQPQRTAPGQPVLAQPAQPDPPVEPEPEPARPEPAISSEQRFFEAEALDALEMPDDLTFGGESSDDAAPVAAPPHDGPRFSTTHRPTTQSFMDEHLGGDGRLRALVIGVAIVLLLAAVWMFFRNGDADRRPLPDPPTAGSGAADEAPEPVRTLPQAAPEGAPVVTPEAAEPDAGSGVAAEEAPGEEIPDDGPLDEEEAKPKVAPPVFKPSILIGNRSKVLVQGARRAGFARELEGQDAVLNECVFGEVANPTGKTYRGFTPVRIACDGPNRDFCRALGCSDDAIVCHTHASAVDTCDPTKPVDPWEGIAPDEVTGTAPATFRPAFRIRSSSKVYSRGTGDAVPLDTLPGGLEVENRCVFAQSSKDKTHRRLYPGYEHLALFCAGPQSALCKALGCGSPGELCHLVASGASPCSIEGKGEAEPTEPTDE